MPTYYRWMERGADLNSAKTGQLTYHQGQSNKAFWIFNMLEAYRPSKSLATNRVLVAIEINTTGEGILKNRANWIDVNFDEIKGFANQPRFVGEAQHPDHILVKQNELGAYGLGKSILENRLRPQVTKIRLADKKEVAKATGLKEIEVDSQKLMNNQKW